MLYNSFQISAKAVATSSQTQTSLRKAAKDNEATSSTPWGISCNINIHSTLSPEGSSGNFCLTPQENKDTRPSPITKPSSAVCCTLSGFPLLIAPYLTHCTGLKGEGAVAWARSGHTQADYSPARFHPPED